MTCKSFTSAVLFGVLLAAALTGAYSYAQMLVLSGGRGGAVVDGGGGGPIEGSNEERILAALDDAPVSERLEACVVVLCPDDPVTTTTHNVTDATELTTALGGNGRLVNVAAGSYSGLSIPSGRTDIDLVLADTASFSGLVTCAGSCARIRITGGDFNYTAGYTVALTGIGVTDILFDNVNLAEGVLMQESGGAHDAPARIAFVNSTIRSPSSSFFAFLAVVTDLIVAATDINNADETTASMRLVSPVRSIVGRNCIDTQGNRIYRVHADNGDANLNGLIGNLLTSDANNDLWWGPNAGGSHDNAITNSDVIGNEIYIPDGGVTGDPAQTDSDNNGGIDNFVVQSNNLYVTLFNGERFSGNQPTNYTHTGNSYNSPASPPSCATWGGGTVGADH